VRRPSWSRFRQVVERSLAASVAVRHFLSLGWELICSLSLTGFHEMSSELVERSPTTRPASSMSASELGPCTDAGIFHSGELMATSACAGYVLLERSVGVSPDLTRITLEPQAGNVTRVPAAAPLTVDRAYSKFLPSFNLRFRPNDEIVLRAFGISNPVASGLGSDLADDHRERCVAGGHANRTHSLTPSSSQTMWI